VHAVDAVRGDVLVAVGLADGDDATAIAQLARAAVGLGRGRGEWLEDLVVALGGTVHVLRESDGVVLHARLDPARGDVGAVRRGFASPELLRAVAAVGRARPGQAPAPAAPRGPVVPAPRPRPAPAARPEPGRHRVAEPPARPAAPPQPDEKPWPYTQPAPSPARPAATRPPAPRSDTPRPPAPLSDTPQQPTPLSDTPRPPAPRSDTPQPPAPRPVRPSGPALVARQTAPAMPQVTPTSRRLPTRPTGGAPAAPQSGPGAAPSAAPPASSSSAPPSSAPSSAPSPAAHPAPRPLPRTSVPPQARRGPEQSAGPASFPLPVPVPRTAAGSPDVSGNPALAALDGAHALAGPGAVAVLARPSVGTLPRRMRATVAAQAPMPRSLVMPAVFRQPWASDVGTMQRLAAGLQRLSHLQDPQPTS
jgi:hypothetical protein